jgi:MFS family permease
MIVQEERGLALSVSAFGSLWGPVLGPVAGGFLTQAVGWRWIFWVITIAVFHSIRDARRSAYTDI